MGIRYVAERHIVVDDRIPESPFWAWDKSFDGLAVTLIGGGPSLADLDLDVLRGHRFIAINSGCRKVRPIASAEDPLFFHDNGWAQNRPELLLDWPGPVITSNRNAKARLGNLVRRINMAALCEALEAFPDYLGPSSGHTAACLAAAMGARRIVLIGFEGKMVDGRSHGHNDYQMDSEGPFRDRFLPGWTGLKPVFQRLGVDVLNATPDSAVLEFPFVDLREALKA